MTAVDAIVGCAVAEVVAAELFEAGGEQPSIRLSGFREEEIRHLVARLLEMDLRLPQSKTPVAIVVGSHRPRPGIPAHVFLQPGWTQAKHRNNNDHGLVLISLDTEGDENSVRAMHTLSDSDLLDDPEPSVVRKRLRHFAEISWLTTGDNPPLESPEVLLTVLDDIFNNLVMVRRPALRTWVSYLASVTGELAPLHRALTGSEVRAVASLRLPHLNLFPDPMLFEQPAELGRRLHRNIFMSDLKAPQGRPMRDEELTALIESVSLLDPDGNPLGEDATEQIRQDMKAVLDVGGPDALHAVDLRDWEQLFARRRTSVGLGDQIRAHLAEHHSHLVAEFDALEVQDGLDEGDEAAALHFLRSEPAAGEQALADSLTSSLRKKVERLAFQGERVASDPLIAVLYGLNALEAEVPGGEKRTVTLKWEQATHGATKSAQLFAFLYRQTLAEIVEACDGTIGARFELDEFIQQIPSLEDLFSDPDPLEDEDEDDTAQEWAPLRFGLGLTGTTTPLIRFRWDPRAVAGLVSFAFLIGTGGSSVALEIKTLDDWCERSFDLVWQPQDDVVLDESEELVRLWSQLNHEHFEQWKLAGLSVAGLDLYLDAWRPLLQSATEEYVPKGGALRGLDQFLERDTARTADGRFVMLGSHPLRLRWFRHHLDNLETFIRRALLGELRLNSENDGVYFRWIERVSPHRQPPVMSPGNQLLATSVRELQMHEEYALVPASDDQAPDWLGAIDDSSIDELIATTRSFLMAFPQKVGGLSVLLMVTTGAASVARRFVEGLRQRELASLNLELHVATAASDHDNVALALSALDSDEGRGRTLLPSFRLMLHDWQGDVPSAFQELDGRVDIALAPNLFGLHSTALEETRRSDVNVGGHFDPWLDPTTHTRPTDERVINVSQVLLPATPDPMLQNWSTLTVRRRRQAPVAAGDPTSTDFVTVQVAFDRNEALFEQLHDVAHWVVTLDPFVGRDQIDALNNAPDVIVVKSGIGKNETNTLVVSSAAGKSWVTRQLANRLVDDFGFERLRAQPLAVRLYEIGRHVVPGLMLRAVGLGRTTEEILGLILARYAVDQFGPELSIDGMQYWVSLDEHTDWFGGPNRMRPDLLRVRLLNTEDGTRLDLLVLESKFRRKFDFGAADEQLSSGVRLMDAAFHPGDDAPDDAKFWRRELWTAITELSRRPAGLYDLPAVQSLGLGADEATMLEDLRSGNYKFEGTETLLCGTGWTERPGPVAAIGQSGGGHPLLRLGSESILGILHRIEFSLAAGATEVVGDAPATPEESFSQVGSVPERARLVPEVSLGRENEEPVETADAATPAVADGTSPNERVRGVSDLELESRYAKVLSKLDQLGVDVDRPEAEPYKEGPGFCLYRIVPRPGVSADRITGKADDIKLALALPAELNIRSYLDKGSVVFEVPKEDADRYFVTAQSVWDRTSDRKDALSVPIGEDIEGAVVELNFSSSDTPHLLIAGQTGSGKSIVLETILTGMCRWKDPSELQLLLVDPKSTELVGLAEDPHVRGEIGWLPDEAIAMLGDGTAEMNRRYQLFRAQKTRSLPEYNAVVPTESRIPWWVIVLDEYADLTSDPDDRKAIESDLKRVAQKGRAAGIHLIVATQKPSAEVISTVIRSNLPSQLALRVKSAIDSRIILEEAGAESLAGKGDAFLRTTKGLCRLQCAMIV